MFNPLIYLLFSFVSINWFLIFIPAFQFSSFNWFLIWTCMISSLLIINHPFIDGFYFAATLDISSYALLVLFIFTLFFIGFLYTLFQSSVSNYKELPTLLLIAYFGFTTLMVSNDLLILYLSIELFSLTFYLITTIHQNYYTTEAGIKYFIYNFLAGAFYLLGCTLIYLDYGTINFTALVLLESTLASAAGAFGFIFIIISFLFKLSIAPFHFWTPDVYQGVLYPITAFFTIFPKFIIITFFFKFYLYILYVPYLNYLLMFCGVLSVFIGTIGAFTQYNIKRLFAYSTISNAGFLIILISLGTPLASQYFFFYILTYILANLGVFTVLINANISNMLGLKNIFIDNPIYALFLSLPVLSLAGLPPFVGFLAKFLSIYLIFNNNLILISVILLIFSILSLFYYLRFIHYALFYDSPKESSIIIPNLYQSYIIIGASIALLLFSFNPALLFLTSSVFSTLVF
jgi:NADH-quinone oxidoreductase subunit N